MVIEIVQKIDICRIIVDKLSLKKEETAAVKRVKCTTRGAARVPTNGNSPGPRSS